MKHIKIFFSIFLLAAILIISSCKKNFEELNTPHNTSSIASVGELYNAIAKSMVLGYQQQAVAHGWIYPFTQQAVSVQTGSFPLDNATNEIWPEYYNALSNYRIIEKQINESSDKTKWNNVYAMLKTLIAYKTYVVTNYFGDIPFSKAGYAFNQSTEALKPTYDKQADIYPVLLDDLKWAIDNFSSDAQQNSIGNYETFLKNDINMWKKFANSLRLRIAVTMYDKNQSVATTHITDALNKSLIDDGEDVGIWPTKITSLTLPGREWSFSSECFIRMGSVMWDMMSNNNNTDGSGIFDPRCKVFFEVNGANNWVAYPQNTDGAVTEKGSPYDKSRYTNWNAGKADCQYSPFNLFLEKDVAYMPELMITSAEVHFLKAEIYTRSLASISKDLNKAKTEYENGVTASVNFWGSMPALSQTWDASKRPIVPTATDIQTLLTNPKVKFDISDEAGSLKKIYAQWWIDGLRQPWEIWTLQRRTGGATPVSTTNVQYYQNTYGSLNGRLLYPSSEFNYNNANWKLVTGGTDLRTTKIWIAK